MVYLHHGMLYSYLKWGRSLGTDLEWFPEHTTKWKEKSTRE